MRFIPRTAALLLAGAALIAPGPLHAAGFALFEQGARRTVAHTELGAVRHYRQAEEVHGDHVLQLIDGMRVRIPAKIIEAGDHFVL